MSIEDRLRHALRSAPTPTPSAKAWAAVTGRVGRRRNRRWTWGPLVLVPILGVGGAALELSGALTPAGHSTQVSVVPSPAGKSPWPQDWSVPSQTVWAHGSPPNYLAFGPATNLTCAGVRRTDCYVVVQTYGMGPKATSTAAPAPSALYRSTDTGSTWRKLSLPEGAWVSSPLACSGPTHCAAGAVIGADPNGGPGQSGRAVLLSTNDAGGHWSTHVLPAEVGLVPDLACSSASRCVALAWGRHGTEIAGVGPESGANRFFETTVLTTVDGGRTWRRAHLPSISAASEHYYFSSVACPRAQSCVAIGQRATMTEQNAGYVIKAITHLILHSANGGRSWRSASSSPTTALYGLSCGAQQSCLAVGQEISRTAPSSSTTVMASRDAGRTWVAVRDSSALLSGFGSPPVSLSCASSSDCLVVASDGEMAATSDGGRDWRVIRSLPPAGGSSRSSLTAVSCAPSGKCFALQDLYSYSPATGSGGTVARVISDSTIRSASASG